MGKQGKSSATSATRKKHQRKANALDPSISIAPQTKSQGKGKGKKSKEPRVKQYIPPPKFKPLVEDPIDKLATTGLLPPNMVLSFRGLSKKDPVTKTKALEDLSGMLVDEAWVAALPLWLWHFVPLSVHPSRRIRELNASMHAQLIARSDLRDELQNLVPSHTDAAALLAAWILGANDVASSVAAPLMSCWTSTIHWRQDSGREDLLDIQDQLQDLVPYIMQAVIEPNALYQQFAPLSAAIQDGTDKADSLNAQEQPQDRDARLRTSGLSAIGWILENASIVVFPQLISALQLLLSSNPLFSSVLCPKESPPFLNEQSVEGVTEVSLGYGQRSVRAAGWRVVKLFIKYLRELAPPTGDKLKYVFLSSLGASAVRSAWVEPDSGVRASMWEGLLALITTFPEVWNIASPTSYTDQDQDGDSDSESDDEVPPNQTPSEARALPSGHAGYLDFLTFLQLGCLGSGVQSYPAVTIVLSTIPSNILPYDHPNLERLFNSLWAAYDGGALNALPRDREPMLKAFLSALLECAVLIFRRLKGRIASEDTAEVSSDSVILHDIIATWMGRVVTESVKGGLLNNISPKVVGILFGSCVEKLERTDAVAVERAWSSTWAPILADSRNEVHQMTNAVQLLASTFNHVQDAVINRRYVKDSITLIMGSYDSAAAVPSDVSRQGEILRILWEFVQVDETWLVEVTEQVLSRGLIAHLISTGQVQVLKIILNGFLPSQASIDRRSSIWCDFLGKAAILSPTILGEVLNCIKFSSLSLTQNSKFFTICESWARGVSQGDSQNAKILGLVLEHWSVCLSRSQLNELVEPLVALFAQETEQLIFFTGSTAKLAPLLSLTEVLHAALPFMDLDLPGSHSTLSSAHFGALLYVAPALRPCLPPELGTLCSLIDAMRITWPTGIPPDTRTKAEEEGRFLIARLLDNCDITISALDVIDVAHRSGLYADERDILSYALPPQSTFIEVLNQLTDNPSSTLAEFDPLVPAVDHNPTSPALVNFDSQGLARYARIVSALASVLSQSRWLAKEQLWCFPHLLALQQLCSDYVLAPSWPSDVFQPDSREEVQRLLSIVSQLIVYLENSLLTDLGLDWHRELVARLSNPMENSSNPKTASDVLAQIYYRASRIDAPLRTARLFRRVITMALRDSGTVVLDIWAGFAQSIQSQQPLLSIAIGSVVALRGVESPRLDRWRNELASRITGILPDGANSLGIPLLRMLNSLAPPAESGIAFLPQQRGVYLIQALQKWMTSDEDLDDSLETYITATACHLIPILQTVPGAHWEFIFDILESNIIVDGESPPNLYLLLQTLRALYSIHEYSLFNKALHESWSTRTEGVFESILLLFLSTTDQEAGPEIREKYHLSLVECIRAIPNPPMKSELFDQLLPLVANRDVTIKAMAYELARKTVIQITEQRVVEAAMISVEPEQSEFSRNPELPASLITQLTQTTVQQSPQNYSTLLLWWWIALDFFDGSSLKLKQGYLEQLRRLDLFKLSLVPCLFELLHIGIAGVKPFPLAPWYVEDYYFNLYDDSLPTAINVMAAHTYYKALKFIPGLIRNWWSECQDKQLALSLATFTKSYFSPVLVKQELEQFRSSAASATEALSDDAFSVKVASSVSEISAVYTVDEQTIEIAVRLPPEFPLKAAEVRDVRGISGMENRRRAWVFGVQQTAQQGLIYDALSVYKKNVAGHFEGKSECAICYSLISVTDRSLPTKPCRTCKNRFHASCLYKWFNTSHSSTCPLCRSDIF